MMALLFKSKVLTLTCVTMTMYTIYYTGNYLLLHVQITVTKCKKHKDIAPTHVHLADGKGRKIHNLR